MSIVPMAPSSRMTGSVLSNSSKRFIVPHQE
jgi:hypothetical protein